MIAFWYHDEDNHNDFFIFLLFSALTAAAIYLTGVFCNTFIYSFVSGYILRDAPFNHPLSKEKTRTKFIGSMWQLVIHCSMAIWEMYILYDEPWISHTHTSFEPHPYMYVPKYSLRVFFVAQIAIWILTCFSHRFNSDAHAHKDYFVMYIHHVVTILLVTVAYWDNQARIGIAVLLAHDVSDIGIDLLKICNYLRLEGAKSFFIVETVYAISIALWVYFRLYLFPVEIFYKGSFMALDVIPGRVTEWGTYPLLQTMDFLFGRDSYQYQHFWTSCGLSNILLAMLLVMHVWWFALLLRILLRMCKDHDPHKAGAAEYEGGSDNEHED